jgi:hypothetical protein
VRKAIEGFVRLGYVAKAVVYLLIGILALRVAIGARGGRITDQSGALTVVLHQPMGSLLVLVLAIGLLTYAGWQIVAAVAGRRQQAGGSAWSRGLTIVRAAVYAAIGVQALRLAIGLRAGHSGPAPLIRAALHWPFGQWMVLAAGIGAAIYGIVEIRHAIAGRLEPDLDAPALRRAAGAWALDVARAGIIARALVMVILAIGVVRAALAERASAAGGMDTSLLLLNSLPSGRLVLGATAAGLLAYGIYQLLHARFAQVG